MAQSGTDLPATVLHWYADNARDLPWRRPGTTPWAVLVSEVMLQQTPVSRVLPAYGAWLARWPDAPSLAAEPAGEAVRQWGRLGYPRRALRLHAAAVAITERHDGRVPADPAALRALPGVGEYTAAAVAAFAFRQRRVVLDTNVRRVLARAVTGVAGPGPAVSAAERRLAARLLPAQPDEAATYAVAVMELGAVVCTARAPRCDRCPLAEQCALHRSGRVATAAPARRPQPYSGTDRQARGALLAVLRAADRPVPLAALQGAWPDVEQGDRALAGLVSDGLAVEVRPGRYALPG